MKTTTCGILVVLACATSVVYGAQPAPGVAGVDVSVKQMPAKRSVTDARGNFALNGLAPGSYILSFRSREAKDLTRTPVRRNPKDATDRVTMASSFSIKIEGTKHSVNQSGLTNDKLTAGVNIPIEIGSGGQIRGQVLATEMKRMVWIPKETGSNLGGRWVAADSAEARSRRHSIHTADDLKDLKWNANAIDERDPRNDQKVLGPLAPRS